MSEGVAPPAKFDGSSAAYTTRDFGESVDDYFTLTGVDEKDVKRRLLYIKTWMSGESKMWFSTLLAATLPPDTVKTAIDALIARYEPQVSRPSLILELGRMVQGENESVVAYTGRLRSQVELLGRHGFALGVMAGVQRTVRTVATDEETGLYK
ncbi:hypothetical protein BC828DRAFT_419210 [Blastocladiella britannica]|nr:hypothetical protein BC828DRAFT_419210 [Blastocladiella britannica]